MHDSILKTKLGLIVVLISLASDLDNTSLPGKPRYPANVVVYLSAAGLMLNQANSPLSYGRVALGPLSQQLC